DWSSDVCSSDLQFRLSTWRVSMSAPAHKQPFPKRDEELDRYINLKLAALGLPVSRSAAGSDFLQIAGPLLRNYYQKDRQLGNWLCASDSRIQDFLDAYLSDVCPQGAARLPGNTFVLDREGMARVLSLPVTSDSFSSPVRGFVPAAAGCAAQSAKRQADDAGAVSHRRGRSADSSGQSSGAQAGVRGAVESGSHSAGRSADATFHGGPGGPCPLLRFPSAASAGLSGRQRRPDLANPRELHLAQIAARLARGIPAPRPFSLPVNAVLAGRRNSPADPKAGLPPLAVHSPIHYQELPELFMDFICSLTGKSPATTGFGSEGALTKTAFNALPPVVDLNNALVSFILTGYAGFTTSAGYVG